MGIKSKILDSIVIGNSLLSNTYYSKIIFYHDLHAEKFEIQNKDSTDFNLFREHFQILKRLNFEIVEHINSQNKQVVICFDDGYRGILNFLDFFIQNNIKSKIFIITDSINNKNFLTSEEIRELYNTNLFSFGLHTHNHVNLGHLKSEDEIKYQVMTCKNILSEILNIEITELCLPRGIFSRRSIDLCHELGITKIYGSFPTNKNLQNEIVLGRSLVQNASPLKFQSILKGGDAILKHYYKRKHFVA